MIGPVLFRPTHPTVIRPTGETVFEDLTWTVHDGETWAVVGPVGSGAPHHICFVIRINVMRVSGP